MKTVFNLKKSWIMHFNQILIIQAQEVLNYAF